jgi:hypothetical protein
MSLVAAGLNSAANGFTAAYPYISLHTTGAVSSSANESSAARVAASWGGASGGVVTFTNKAFTGGASSGAAIRVGYWSASTAGTYGGGSLLTGDQTFNAAGEYTITTCSETFA